MFNQCPNKKMHPHHVVFWFRVWKDKLLQHLMHLDSITFTYQFFK